MFPEVSLRDFDHVTHLNWDIKLSQKNPSDWLETLIVIISGKNSSEYVRLFFWTDKNILRNELLNKGNWNKEYDWFGTEGGASWR